MFELRDFFTSLLMHPITCACQEYDATLFMLIKIEHLLWNQCSKCGMAESRRKLLLGKIHLKKQALNESLPSCTVYDLCMVFVDNFVCSCETKAQQCGINCWRCKNLSNIFSISSIQKWFERLKLSWEHSFRFLLLRLRYVFFWSF